MNYRLGHYLKKKQMENEITEKRTRLAGNFVFVHTGRNIAMSARALIRLVSSAACRDADEEEAAAAATARAMNVF